MDQLDRNVPSLQVPELSYPVLDSPTMAQIRRAILIILRADFNIQIPVLNIFI